MTTAEIRAEKAVLRDKYKVLRKEFAKEQLKKEAELKIFQNVISSKSYKFCKSVLIFASLPDEPYTFQIAEKALCDQKPLYFPKVYKGGIMRFFKVDSLDMLKTGHFGVLEPEESADEYIYSERSVDLCLVPGLLYDASGHRLGYGRGYYDRFLSKFTGISCGLFFSEFRYEQALPIEKRYDKAIDMVITEKGVEIFAQKQ